MPGNVIIPNWKSRDHQCPRRNNISYSQLSHQSKYSNNGSQNFQFIINPYSVDNNDHMSHAHA